jgi:uncharacterized protein (TIGR02266 family)
MGESRREKRAPVALKVKYKSASIDEFIEQASLNVSSGGIFVKTGKPMKLGTALKLEFQLSDATPVIRGVGKVAWRRENAASAAQPAGMGIKFIKLNPEGREVVERIVAGRAKPSSRFDESDGSEVQPPSMTPPAAEPRPRAARAPAAQEAGPVAGAGVPTSAFGGKPRGEDVSWAEALSRRESAGEGPDAAPAESEPFAEPASAAIGWKSRYESEKPAEATPSAAGEPAEPPEGLFRESALSHTPVTDSEPAPSETAPSPAEASAPDGAVEDPPGFGEVNPAPAAEDPFGVPADIGFGDALERASSEPPLPSEQSVFDDAPQQLPSSNPPPPTPEETAPTPEAQALDEQRPGADFQTSSPIEEEERISSVPPPVPSEPPSDSEPPPSDSEPPSSDSEPPSSDSEPPPSDSEPPPSDSEPPPSDSEPPSSDSEPPEEASEKRAGYSEPGPPPEAVSVPPVKGKKSSTALPAAIVVVLCVIGGGGYFYLGSKGDKPQGKNSEPVGIDMESPPPKPEPEPSPAAKPAPAPEPPAEPEAKVAEGAETESEEMAVGGEEAAGVTRVQVTSVPEKASLQVDGKPGGATPVTAELPIGKPVRISLKADGYQELIEKVTAEEDNPPLSFELKPLDYLLVVNTTPPGAQIISRGKTVISPASINLGQMPEPVSINLVKDGYRATTMVVRRNQFIETPDARRYVLNLSLSPLPEATPASPEKTSPATTRTRKKKVTRPTAPRKRKRRTPSSPEPADEPAPKPAPADLPDNPF